MGEPISPFTPATIRVAPAAADGNGDHQHFHSHGELRPGYSAQDTLESEVGETPSIELARKFGQASRPHRVPDPSQPTGYRLARPGEAFENVSYAYPSLLRSFLFSSLLSSKGRPSSCVSLLLLPFQSESKAEPYGYFTTTFSELDEFGKCLSTACVTVPFFPPLTSSFPTMQYQRHWNLIILPSAHLLIHHILLCWYHLHPHHLEELQV